MDSIYPVKPTAKGKEGCRGLRKKGGDVLIKALREKECVCEFVHAGQGPGNIYPLKTTEIETTR